MPPLRPRRHWLSNFSVITHQRWTAGRKRRQTRQNRVRCSERSASRPSVPQTSSSRSGVVATRPVTSGSSSAVRPCCWWGYADSGPPRCWRHPSVLTVLPLLHQRHAESYAIVTYRAFTRSSKRPASARRVFWIHLLEVCRTFARSCKHPVTHVQVLYTALLEWGSDYAVRTYTTPDSVAYRIYTTLGWHRLRRRLLYDARMIADENTRCSKKNGYPVLFLG